MLLDINNREVNVQFIGRFNASNLLAVYGAACLLGKRPEDILVKLSMLRPVSGRFDAKRSPKGYTAIVDYAHTPDALVNVLEAIHEVLRGRGQVITVVGAGGNRDKGKRPLMAKESAQRSDKVIITSDNPRFEESDQHCRSQRSDPYRMYVGSTTRCHPDCRKRTRNLSGCKGCQITF